MNSKIIHYLMFLLSFVRLICPLKILIFCPGISRSHVIFNHRVASTLTSQGHEVVVHNALFFDESISKLQAPHGIKEIRQDAPKMDELSKEALGVALKSFGEVAFRETSGMRQALQTIGFASFFKQITMNSCKETLENEKLMEELKNANFDLILSHYFNPCPLAISRMIGLEKIIYLSPGTYIFDTAAVDMGIPTMPSYIPNAMSGFNDRMSFFERMQNLFFHICFIWSDKVPAGNSKETEENIFRLALNNANRRLAVGTKSRNSLRELAKDSLMTLFLNGEEVLDYPRPFLPGMLFLGQLEHQIKPKELDQTWQTLISGNTDGVILFSLGTVANTSDMPIEMKDTFADAFSQFSTYTIIWRLEGQLPATLENNKHIKIVHWLPQRDLLHHGNVKLFITHGGYNSLVETAQAGVPMLLLPLFGDQQGNAKRAERRGIGLTLDKAEINTQTIVQKMKVLLNDPGYAIRNQRLSKIMQDKLLPNEEIVNKQLQRLARTKRWPLARSRYLSFIQLYCIDIIFVIITVIVIGASIFIKMIHLMHYII